MKYKIIAMDFDGTLLTKNKKITERTKRTLLECKQNNYIIIGVTAKIYPVLKMFVIYKCLII